MKVYNKNNYDKIHNSLIKEIEKYRSLRNFKPIEYIQKKSELLNQYMKKCKLDTAVIAVSGGIDSSLVLALVKNASKLPDSPIKKIVPVAMIMY